MVLIIAWRAHGEEQVLLHQLAGYTQYCRIVRHRLVPFVW